MDGTFYSVPAPYRQFFTIHGQVTERIVPLVYVLMADKTTGAYRQVSITSIIYKTKIVHVRLWLEDNLVNTTDDRHCSKRKTAILLKTCRCSIQYRQTFLIVIPLFMETCLSIIIIMHNHDYKVMWLCDTRSYGSKVDNHNDNYRC